MDLDKDEKPAFLLWADLETTGLDPEKDVLLEVAFILTEFDWPYQELRRGAFLVRQSEGWLSRMDDFVKEMHTKSGLLADLATHAEKTFRVHEVELGLLELSKDWPVMKEKKNLKVVLAGNSVHFDKDFLKHHMPEFHKRLSHRIFDASVASMICRSMGMPRLPKNDETKGHRAGYDVQQSIEQMRACVNWLKSLDAITRVVT